MNTESIPSAVPIEHHTSASAPATTGSGRKYRVEKGWRRIMYLALAGVFCALGFAGVALPGLPATPFLLLTSYFLVRSSPRLHRKLLRSRFFGPILIDWHENGGVRLHLKIKAVVVVLLTVAVTIQLSGYSGIVAFAICGLAAVGVIVICRLPLARDEPSLPEAVCPLKIDGIRMPAES